jgi:hypothetical protein
LNNNEMSGYLAIVASLVMSVVSIDERLANQQR